MKYIITSLLLTSFFINIYFFSRPVEVCELQKEEILSKIDGLTESEIDEKYAGKLLLLLLAELGLKEKIKINSSIFNPVKCEDKVIERVVEKVIPKEVIKTVIKKERALEPFLQRNTVSFMNILNNPFDPKKSYDSSYLSIFEENRIDNIPSGVYVIEHEKSGKAFETLTIENKMQYRDKIWQGKFSSKIIRNEKKVLSEFETVGANSKIFTSKRVANTVTWKQKDFMILMWLSQKERLRFNGVIYKKDKDGEFEKYGNLMLQNF